MVGVLPGARRVAGVMACALVCGCARTVGGAAVTVAPVAPVVLADALVEPSRFPAPYRAAVLDPQGTVAALGDLEGVPSGATITPPRCAPAPVGPAPRDAVAAQGVDPQTGAALIVTLTRTGTPLPNRQAQLSRCASFAATAGEVVSTVHTAVLPAPPVDADASLATEATIRRSTQPPVRVRTLAAQIGDVRVTAAWLNDDAADVPDTAALDGLFADAVQTLRRAAR